MQILQGNLGYSKTRITLLLIAIAFLSAGLKLYTADFSSPSSEDTYGYVLRSIGHLNGDFTEPPRKTLGWSLFISPFFSLVNSSSFLDYLNTIRGISMGISVVTIFPMYLLARRFFDEKYSIVAAFLLAIEPHLNHNATLGLSEPIFILVGILAVYLILSKKIELVYLSYVSVGILWWIRFNGIVMLLIISIIYFTNFKQSKNLLQKFFIGLALFFIVSSPMLYQRYDQYGDPLYFSQSATIYTGDYAAIMAENSKLVNYSAFDYIADNGLGNFFNKFIIGGLYHLADQTIKLSFPYLVVLLPFGILFSFRAFDQDPKNIRANWIVILITLGSFVTYFAVVQDRRLIFHILPFLVVFSIIPIQRLVEYGLSTFSFSTNKKNISLLIILGIVLLLSFMFTMRYEISDKAAEQEKIQFSNHLLNNYAGNILDAGNTLDFLRHAVLTRDDNFKKYTSTNDITYTKLTPIELYAKSLNDFVLIAEKYDLKYISVNKEGVTEVWYPFLADVYENESKYPYLNKIIDTDNMGFNKLHVRVYFIDYEKFHELYPSEHLSQ